MKRPFLLVLFLLLSLCVFAQDTTKRAPLLKPFSTYLHDTLLPAGPNEIAVNVAPLFAALLGGNPQTEWRVSVFYKRALKDPRWATRLGLTYKPAVKNAAGEQQDFIYQGADSTRTRNSFLTERKKPLQLNLGFERRSKGPWRWTSYVALDLTIGFYNRRYQLVDYRERLDTTGNWNIDYTTTDPKLVLDDKTSFTWYVGVNPNAGIRYAFTSHWLLSLQAGVDLFYISGRSYTRSANGYSLEGEDLEPFDYYAPGIFNEFAITYRF